MYSWAHHVSRGSFHKKYSVVQSNGGAPFPIALKSPRTWSAQDQAPRRDLARLHGWTLIAELSQTEVEAKLAPVCGPWQGIHEAVLEAAGRRQEER
jgi:hypothetical protein